MTTERVTGTILAVGDPVEGFGFHGPFTDNAAAMAYGRRHLEDIEWWVIKLVKISEEAGEDHGGTTIVD